MVQKLTFDLHLITKSLGLCMSNNNVDNFGYEVNILQCIYCLIAYTL